MDGEQTPTTAADAVTVTPPAAPPVQSPPKPVVVERPVEDGREKLLAMAAEVAKKGTRKLLWDYLRLRSRVLGR